MWHYEPPAVKLIKPKWGNCRLCGSRKPWMVYVKDLKAIVCPEHEAYTVVSDYDDGEWRVQEVVEITATAEDARKLCAEYNRQAKEARIATGCRFLSYTTAPLRQLIGARKSFGELEEDLEESL